MDTQTNEQNQELRNKPTKIYDQLILDTGAKNTQWGKDSSSNKWCWENWIITYKRIKSDPILYSHNN